MWQGKLWEETFAEFRSIVFAVIFQLLGTDEDKKEERAFVWSVFRAIWLQGEGLCDVAIPVHGGKYESSGRSFYVILELLQEGRGELASILLDDVLERIAEDDRVDIPFRLTDVYPVFDSCIAEIHNYLNPEEPCMIDNYYVPGANKQEVS